MPPILSDFGPAPAQRRQSPSHLRLPRRTSHRKRRAFCRLGTQCPARKRGWVTSTPGTDASTPCATGDNAGVWELFIPDLTPGTLYKYEIKTQNGDIFTKSDPYAFCMEHRPRTASVVYQPDDALWSDTDWLQARQKRDPYTEPIAIYEVHLGSWRRNPDEDNRSLTYRELAHELVEYVLEMGLHPHRTPPHHGTSLRRILGLSGHGLLRANQPIWHAR